MVYRIQLGAYSHKLSRDLFSNIDNLVEVKTENGFYTYSAGSYTNYMDAVNYKTQLMTQGFPDAFIKAYKDGKRIPLKDAGATYIQPTKEDLNEQVTHETSTLDKTQITFKVQVGVFRGVPPDDMAARFKTLSDLTTDRDTTGLTHYLVGSYTDFESAKNVRDKLGAESVLKDCFVVAYFKDKPMPLDQALDIMKK
jgi:SPOR domain